MVYWIVQTDNSLFLLGRKASTDLCSWRKLQFHQVACVISFILAEKKYLVVLCNASEAPLPSKQLHRRQTPGDLLFLAENFSK